MSIKMVGTADQIKTLLIVVLKEMYVHIHYEVTQTSGPSPEFPNVQGPVGERLHAM